MPSNLRRPMIVLLLASALLLCSCQVPLPYLPVQLAGDEPTAVSGEATPVPIEEALAVDAEAEVGNEAAAGAETEDGELVETGAEADVEAMAEAGQTSATVIVRSLRIRSGPGVEHDVVAGAAEGESFPVVGHAFDCQWLQIEHPTLGRVWLSGLPQYTSFDGGCAQLAQSDGATTLEEAPVLPTPTTVAEEPAPEDAAVEPAPTPEPQPESGEAEGDMFPADMGCYLIQNYLGPELNITITAQDRQWSDNFQIGEDEEAPYCLSPGRYTVTIDAPPPWGDLNDELTVQAGDRYYWPIRPGE